jgi:hypothetical protein
MNLESNLEQLGAAGVPDLSTIDGAALAIRARMEAGEARRALSIALLAALGIGVLGGMQAPASEDASLMAFGPPLSLTPLIALGQP